MTDGILRGRSAAAAFWLLLAPLPVTATTEWNWHKTADGAHPDGNEQQMMWLMNRARANPAAEGDFLAATGEPGVQDAISFFKVNVAKMKAEFAALPAMPPAVFDRRIYEGSRQHALDLIRRNTQDHNGQLDRIKAAGFSYSRMGVSVYSYTASALEAHALLSIDIGQTADGMQAGRSHRRSIMASGGTALSNAGFALARETNPATDVGPLVFAGAYAAAPENVPNHFNRFITGTVWDDLNKNLRYDPGEGKAGVLVQPDHGAWHAITGAAGGYAIPVTEPGAFRLTFSGGGLPETFTRSTTVADKSILLDLKAGESSPRPLTSDIRLAPDGRSVILEWRGGTPRWLVQQFDSNRDAWIDFGEPTLQTSVTLPLSGRTEFFRVLEGR